MTDYHAVATQAANRYGIPVQTFLRQIQQESGFSPGARSPAGAIGIAQFMPATARGFGIDPTNPVQALFAAARYDRQGIDKYGSLARALSVYNSGKPDAYLDPGFAHGQTYNYVRQILGGPQVPASPTGNTAAAAAPAIPPPGAAAAPPSMNLAPLLNAGNRAVGLPDINPRVFAVAQTPAGQTVPFARDHGAPPSPHEGHVVALAKQFLGTPYSWGGGGPGGPSRGTGRGAGTVGFDCSSFVQFLAAKQGVQVPRTTFQQFKTGTPVPRNKLQPGDVVFFYPTSQGPDHEGVYLGHGQFIHAPHTGDVVKISRLASMSGVYVGARRLI